MIVWFALVLISYFESARELWYVPLLSDGHYSMEQYEIMAERGRSQVFIVEIIAPGHRQEAIVMICTKSSWWDMKNEAKTTGQMLKRFKESFKVIRES